MRNLATVEKLKFGDTVHSDTHIAKNYSATYIASTITLDSTTRIRDDSIIAVWA